MSEINEDVVDRIPDIDPVLQAEREAKKNKVNPEKLIPTINELPPMGLEPEKPEAKAEKKPESPYSGLNPEKMARDFQRVKHRKDIDD